LTYNPRLGKSRNELIMKLMSYQTLRRDPNAPKELTPAQHAEVNQHVEVKSANAAMKNARRHYGRNILLFQRPDN